jgi:hypothetical protein
MLAALGGVPSAPGASRTFDVGSSGADISHDSTNICGDLEENTARSPTLTTEVPLREGSGLSPGARRAYGRLE